MRGGFVPTQEGTLSHLDKEQPPPPIIIHLHYYPSHFDEAGIKCRIHSWFLSNIFCQDSNKLRGKRGFQDSALNPFGIAEFRLAICEAVKNMAKVHFPPNHNTQAHEGIFKNAASVYN